jgi:hypothetical protein
MKPSHPFKRPSQGGGKGVQGLKFEETVPLVAGGNMKQSALRSRAERRKKAKVQQVTGLQ